MGDGPCQEESAVTVSEAPDAAARLFSPIVKRAQRARLYRRRGRFAESTFDVLTGTGGRGLVRRPDRDGGQRLAHPPRLLR